MKGERELLIKTLFQTGARVSAFVNVKTEDVFFDEQMIWLRSWRRPPPSASVRRKNASWSKDQGVQGLRPSSLQYLYKFNLDHNKIYHLYNYLIFLLFL